MGFDTPGGGGGAPTDAEYVVGSADPDLSAEVVKSPAADLLLKGSFGTSTTISPGFNSWTVIDANNPSFLIAQIEARTDGTSDGEVTVDVDISGGTSFDYNGLSAYAGREAGSNYRDRAGGIQYIPAGASFQFDNVADPTGNNTIFVSRAMTIDPSP